MPTTLKERITPSCSRSRWPETALTYIFKGIHKVPAITTNDGVEIFYKGWGAGQPIVFSHGWPLSADDWDAQMLFFLGEGFRVIAHDRRGHARSTRRATVMTWIATPTTWRR